MTRHAPREVRYSGQPRECQICGLEVYNDGPTLLHVGEKVPTIAPDREDARAFGAARDVVEATLASLPVGATSDDAARALTQELYRRGLLRRRPGRQRPAPETTPVPERYEVERRLVPVG